MHPYRSVLYMPGSNARALEKARSLDADALILDLEDAVAPAEKPVARDLVCAAVKAGGFGARRVLIRINGADTEWGADDLAAAIAAAPHGILVPKVNDAEDVARAAAQLGRADTGLWAMMETPRAILNAAAIAAAPGLHGLVLGTNDLVKDLGVTLGADRSQIATALSLCLLAARAHGLLCIDGVYNAFRDEDGLRAECLQGRDMGFDGKTLVHPAQLAIANAVFAPDPAQMALAQRQIDAHAAALAAGTGVAVVDGKIVENLHVATAKNLIARAEMIAKRAKDAQG
ncbi:MAG: CoA ester lyase [Paracoccaceae bacterium]